jgi:hypothetical protein
MPMDWQKHDLLIFSSGTLILPSLQLEREGRRECCSSSGDPVESGGHTTPLMILLQRRHIASQRPKQPEKYFFSMGLTY